MYHYDPEVALEEMKEDAVLPNPVHVRDMILRRSLSPDRALDLNRQFQAYQKAYADALSLGRELLKELGEAPAKS